MSTDKTPIKHSIAIKHPDFIDSNFSFMAILVFHLHRKFPSLLKHVHLR
jgi:hypothetical protein